MAVSGSFTSPSSTSTTLPTKTVQSVNLYSAASTTLIPVGQSREINLRRELIDTFEGSDLEIAKAREILIRSMNRDDDGNKTQCECVDPLTHEPDKDRLCPICLGEAYLWTEFFEKAYRWLQQPKEVIMPAGLANTPIVVFYMRYDANVLKDDKIIELVLDSAGDAVKPEKRLDVWRIQHIEPYRLDEAKLEFLKIWTYREDVKHKNG